MSFSHAEYVHSILTAPKVLTHSNINFKSKVSSKYVNQVQRKLEVKFHPEVQFLSSYEPVKLDRLCASRMQWWDRHKIDISIPKGRNWKEGRGNRS